MALDMVLGEGGDASWLLDLIEDHEGVYTNKIKDVLSIGDDVVFYNYILKCFVLRGLGYE